MALELTQAEADRFQAALKQNEQMAKNRRGTEWSEERERKIVELLRSGQSVCSIIRDHHVSGRKIEKIRRKYGLWGV